MHSLTLLTSPLVPALCVKSASNNYNIRAVFQLARRFTPCMLILEDFDTIVTDSGRSYLFNEVDGLKSNGGILMVHQKYYRHLIVQSKSWNSHSLWHQRGRLKDSFLLHKVGSP